MWPFKCQQRKGTKNGPLEIRDGQRTAAPWALDPVDESPEPSGHRARHGPLPDNTAAQMSPPSSPGRVPRGSRHRVLPPCPEHLPLKQSQIPTAKAAGRPLETDLKEKERVPAGRQHTTQGRWAQAGQRRNSRSPGAFRTPPTALLALCRMAGLDRDGPVVGVDKQGSWEVRQTRLTANHGGRSPPTVHAPAVCQP